jgi:serine/threonine-protein kinase
MKNPTEINLLLKEIGSSQSKAVEHVTTETNDPSIGRRVGAYRLIRHVATGGMGQVYMAERAGGDFTQRVAVKLIHRGVRDKEAMRRFRNECQVLASLEHPNIARMIDGGITKDGTPYIVMEFVDGKPIDKYCEERDLIVDERLRLFTDVCAAVEHAHKNATIHSDIKPNNILVDDDGAVKLVDFGIARVLDAAEGHDYEHTATGLQVMTPYYASPEQIRNEILTTATDVYSLGVVLCKLLTGQVPYVAATRSVKEIERVVFETSPAKPSEMILQTSQSSGAKSAPPATRRLSRRLRGDLDTIVLMALRKEAERRYESAQHFADDIHRHLGGLPVMAQPDTISYRARKFVHHHAALVTAAAALIVVLVASSIVFFSMYLRAEDERRAAVDAQTAAEQNARKAREVTDFLTQMFKDSAPDVAGGRELTAGEMLERGTRRLDDALDDQPLAKVQLLRTLSEVYRRRGDLETARDLGERALAICRTDLDDPIETAKTLTANGIYLERMKEYGDALAAFLEAESLVAGAGGPDHPLLPEVLAPYAQTLRAAGRNADADRADGRAQKIRSAAQ